MRDSQDWEGSFRGFAVIAVAFILAVAILTWGPWNTTGRLVRLDLRTPN